MKPKVIRSRELNGEKQPKMKKFIQYLEEVQGQNFTGYIKVNFSQGSIGRIERFEEILKK
jgi:hypothetical protein